MQSSPDFAAFEAAYEAGRAQVVHTALIADLETPVSAFLKLAEGKPNAFLFESVEGGSIIGRYSFLGMRPDVIWRCHGDKAEINRRARFDADSFEPIDAPVLDSLRDLIEECRFDLPEGLPPMSSCLLGYMGYDTVRLMETLPEQNPVAIDVPDGLFLRPTVVAVFDRVEDLVTVFTPVWPRSDVSARAAYAQACERLADVAQDFERALPQRRDVIADLDELPDPSANMTQADFEAMVLKAKDYILAGDIFQVAMRTLSSDSSSSGSSSTSAPTPSSAPARKSWCGCATTW